MSAPEIHLMQYRGRRLPWREFMDEYGGGRNLHAQADLTIGCDFFRIQIGETPDEEDFLDLERAAQDGDRDYVRRLQVLASLNPDDSFDFAQKTGGNKTYSAADIENLMHKYPGFNHYSFDPMVFSDFDMFERRGFLWMASRARIGENPALLFRIAPKHDFAHETSPMFLEWALNDPETGGYPEWNHYPSFAEAYGAMCMKFLDKLDLPHESSQGIDWMGAAMRLRKLGCLEAYQGDFFWHDRTLQLVKPGRRVITARSTGTNSYFNSKGSLGTLPHDRRFLAVVDCEPGRLGIIDCRSKSVEEKQDLVRKKVAGLPKWDSQTRDVVELSCFAGKVVCSVLERGKHPHEDKVHFEELEMPAPEWTKVGHPEIPCRQGTRPKLDDVNKPVEDEEKIRLTLEIRDHVDKDDDAEEERPSMGM